MNTTTKWIVKLVFMLPVLFILLIAVIEAPRLLFTWFEIDKAIRLGMLYTVAGKYDSSYCPDVDYDGTYCDGSSRKTWPV